MEYFYPLQYTRLKTMDKISRLKYIYEEIKNRTILLFNLAWFFFF